MAEQHKLEKWEVFPISKTGISHERNNKENQDSIDFLKTEEYISLSIADGHGSDQHPFSMIGSQIATQVFSKTCKEAFSDFKDKELDIENQLTFLKERFAKNVIQSWNEGIHNRFENLKKWLIPQEENSIIRKLFGTTLLGSIIVPNQYAFFFRIGDGNISIQLEDTFKIIFPHKSENKIIGTSTNSLCSKDAIANVQFEIMQQNELDKLRSIVLYTDGYEDSFENDQSLLNNLNFLARQVSSSLDEVSYTRNIQLNSWLTQITTDGSGDDLSMLFSYKLN